MPLNRGYDWAFLETQRSPPVGEGIDARVAISRATKNYKETDLINI
jgi:hypothetical protein